MRPVRIIWAHLKQILYKKGEIHIDKFKFILSNSDNMLTWNNKGNTHKIFTDSFSG